MTSQTQQAIYRIPFVFLPRFLCDLYEMESSKFVHVHISSEDQGACTISVVLDSGVDRAFFLLNDKNGLFNFWYGRFLVDENASS